MLSCDKKFVLKFDNILSYPLIDGIDWSLQIESNACLFSIELVEFDELDIDDEEEVDDDDNKPVLNW